MRARALTWIGSQVADRFWCNGECWPSYTEEGRRSTAQTFTLRFVEFASRPGGRATASRSAAAGGSVTRCMACSAAAAAVTPQAQLQHGQLRASQCDAVTRILRRVSSARLGCSLAEIRCQPFYPPSSRCNSLHRSTWIREAMEHGTYARQPLMHALKGDHYATTRTLRLD
eukprot:scaffold61686_cov69-Phaeocystis_antarctica.AAC.1